MESQAKEKWYIPCPHCGKSIPVLVRTESTAMVSVDYVEFLKEKEKKQCPA